MLILRSPTLLTTLLLALTVPVVAQTDSPRPTIARGADWRAAVKTFAEANLKHPAWGASHSQRDYTLAKSLAAADGVTLDDDVLYAAAWLHDIAAFPAFKKAGVDHQDEAANLVGDLLKDTGFPMAKIDAVRGAIRTHMFARDPVGPEAIYLHDADAIDWLGAIGVARVFGVVDANGGSPNGPEAAAWLESNLKDVPPRVISKAGKSLAKARAAELASFLESLREQAADYRTL